MADLGNLADRPRDGYIDQALVALGSDDTEFWATAGFPAVSATPGKPSVILSCRHQGCEWGLSVGEIELWEFVADAREHWETAHAAQPGGGHE